MKNTRMLPRFISKHNIGAVLVILSVAAIGSIIVFSSQAAAPSQSVSIEPENGVLAGNTSIVSDVSASGANVVQFGAEYTGPQSVTHGEQLTVEMVGPWTLQGVPRGQEQLEIVPVPERGYWRFGDPQEFVPSGAYLYNDDPNNHGGTLTEDTIIDGYLIPAGTKVLQFLDFSESAFYAQEDDGTWLFRGVRVRGNGVGQASLFNDYRATYTNYLHYSDLGGMGAEDSQDGGAFWKTIGGQDHRILRNYVTYVGTAFQPNVNGVEYIENFIDKITFYYGEAGPGGQGGSTTYHLNGISSEGMSNITPTRFKILRNHIIVPSPDEAGRLTYQTDCIALFNSNGGSYNDVLVEGNYLGGSGYVIYAGGYAGAEEPKNIRFINNKVTTKWWTNGGSFGPIAAEPNWGTNGNEAYGNIWADDYGSGGDGNTPISSRQYPNGDGPRQGRVIFGD